MYSDNFNKALTFTLQWEGGYSNNPSDSGGETNRGITDGTYRLYRKKKFLPLRSVKMITEDEIKDIYYSLYWVPMKCDSYDPKLAIALFDFGVNSGIGRAQQYLKTCKDNLDSFIDCRESFLKSIAKGKNSIFLKGWLNRINSLREYLKKIC